MVLSHIRSGKIQVCETGLDPPPRTPQFAVLQCTGHSGFLNNTDKVGLDTDVLIFFPIRIKDLYGFIFGPWVTKNPHKSVKICLV